GGAVGSFLMGKRRPEFTAKLPGGFPFGAGRQMQFAGRTLSVGPCQAVNFPWILLDRAFGVYCYLLGRTHARRDEATLGAAQLKEVLEEYDANSSHWSDEKRRACEKVFAAIRRNKATAEQRETLWQIIREQLGALSQRKIPKS
ncbi:MAG TPA: hypothetical protein VFS35_04030, partial [Terrimicrobiaceae bacterium]|nr:hypothetical protein [Terrimicrobiaceae bacterium]